MVKQWHSNAVFHTYYLQLKRSVESFPRTTPNTLHRFRPIAKFRIDRHFIYITVRGDKHKEEFHSYYKLTEEDMEEITKEWPVEFLVPVEQTELSDPNLIESLVVTHEEYDGPSNSKRKKKEEVQEMQIASEETTLDSPEGGGGDELDKEEDEGKEDKQEQGEVTSLKDPLTETETYKKRNVSPKKPSAWKKSHANNPHLQIILTVDDIDLIIADVLDTSKDIL
jgi:hypothetical protein